MAFVIQHSGPRDFAEPAYAPVYWSRAGGWGLSVRDSDHFLTRDDAERAMNYYRREPMDRKMMAGAEIVEVDWMESVRG